MLEGALGRLNEAREAAAAGRGRALGDALEWLRQTLPTVDLATPDWSASTPDPGPRALEELVERLFGRPACKLAMYGTLAPGEVNHSVIAAIGGSWSDGFVRGTVASVGWGVDYGFPALTWDARGPRVPVKVLESGDLPRHWDRIDAFEGEGYRRILVPVEHGGGIGAIANIYEARPG